VAGLAVSLGGCGVIGDVQEVVEGVTHPVVVGGLILDVAPPAEPALQQIMEASGYSSGVSADLWVVEAVMNGTWEDYVLSGTDVHLHEDESYRAKRVGPGSYRVTDASELEYRAGQMWSVTAASDVLYDVAEVSVDLPQALPVAVPATHQLRQELVLTFDAPPQTYDSLLVVVIGPDGEVTYDNQPTQQFGEELYLFARRGFQHEWIIPAGAFGFEGLHAVGIAGVMTNSPEDVFWANTLFSTLMAGQMQFYAIDVAN
jgi:hypothetical protein